MNKLSLVLIFATILFGCSSTQKDKIKIDEVSFSYSIFKGLEPEQGVCRRDPSDIINVEGTYYLWYTKTEKQYSGYDASIWYATSKDGETWQEQGEAIARGTYNSWE